MQSLRNEDSLYSRTVITWLVQCILLALLWLHPASARSQFPLQRCNFSWRATERGVLKVQVYCEGSKRLFRQESFSEMPQIPWLIFPGLEVFGNDETGKRSLVSIEGISIEVFDSEFPDHLCKSPTSPRNPFVCSTAQRFSISSPVSITNSTVFMTNTHFLSFTTAEMSGGEVPNTI